MNSYIIVHIFFVFYTVISIWYVKLALFVDKRCKFRVKGVQKEKEATGALNVVGNKGGVAITFNFEETSFCFVASHLAAHEVCSSSFFTFCYSSLYLFLFLCFTGKLYTQKQTILSYCQERQTRNGRM